MAQTPHRIERVLGPRLTLKEANLICWGLFLVLLLPAGYRAAAMQSEAGHAVPDADFVNFYAMGRILNEHPGAQLYDTALQKRVRDQIHPLGAGAYAPVPYPPFVGMLFQPLARLPYVPAYHLWMAISLALYLAALTLVSARLFPGEPLRLALIVCLSLSFFPFTIETLINGQISTIAFFAISAAFLLEDSKRPYLSGLALSLCSYKPTLILLLLPMLLVSRRFKALAGFLSGAAALAVFTTVRAGLGVWRAYMDLLFHFSRAAIGVRPEFTLNFAKYVDLAAFSSLLPGGRSWPVLVLLAGGALWAAFCLMRAWWTVKGQDRPSTRLLWAATLTWTLLLNVYVPIYDTILVVLSVLLTLAALRDAPGQPPRRAVDLLWPAIFFAAWFTTQAAGAWRLQLLTVLLAALGIVQLRLLSTPRKVTTWQR